MKPASAWASRWPPRTLDDYYALAEIVLLVAFATWCGLRGIPVVEEHAAEMMFLAVCAASSQAFRIRVSAVDEKLTFGIGAGILGLALPSADLLTVVAVWAVGISVGSAVVLRDVVAGARFGGRSVLAGLAYGGVWFWASVLGIPAWTGTLAATAAFFIVTLVLWRLPQIIADAGLVNSHFIPRRIALALALNAVIPIVTHLGEPLAQVFIVSDTYRMKLVMDLTVTTAVFSVIALVLYGYDARHRLDGVIQTAKALPWPEDVDAPDQMVAFAATTLRVDQVEVRATPPRSRFEIGSPFRIHSGETRYLVARRNPGGSPLLDRDRESLSAIAHIGQETMRVRGEANELRAEASTDPLTGLFNYRGFQAAIDDVNARRGDRGVAVVYIDLDGFKAVNDRYGHEVGNQLLREVGRRLREAVRPMDTVARVGGDEFVVLLRDIRDPDHARQVAHRIVSSAGSPVVLEGHAIDVRLSEGISFSGDSHENLGMLVNEADARMYAKRGRSVPSLAGFAGDVPVGVGPQSGRLADIEELIAERRLGVAYQPIVDGGRGGIVALEALVRGTHPERGPIDASLLVREAKRLGRLDELTGQVLDQAFAGMDRIREVAPALRDLHVNLDLGQISRGPVLARVQQLCAEHPDVRLTVELTEDSVRGAGEEILAKIKELRASGIRLALDDFGQGYSTMLAVVEVPFDALKVDRSLIAGVTTSEKAVQVIRSLTRLCRNLHVDMIVEGVETAEERDVLSRLGVRYLQGFLFARPEDAEAIRARLAAPGSMPTWSMQPIARLGSQRHKET
jgi:diguanylate cyclase (GGDEF)-like protein